MDTIVAEQITKRYGKVVALDGLDLRVAQGTVLGLLGPNGAGKTSAVRVLSTLLSADSGRASVAGLDVRTDAVGVRRKIGLSGQFAAVDDDLTGRENLELVGRLYHLGRRGARRRAQELLERFDLTDNADRQVKDYSGGMRRRVDLAGALVAKPEVLFLDEPTTGLDPRSRVAMWEVITELVAAGSTLLLTTQYLEEADRLADRIAVIDHGRVVAEGTPDELKNRLGGERLELTLAAGSALVEACGALAPIANDEISVDEHSNRLTVPVTDGSQALQDSVRRLDAADVRVLSTVVRRPSLDEVFFALTGATPPERTTTDDPELTLAGSGGHDTTKGQQR